MVHTLVPMSVKIKIKNFETPARLINHMELSCAVGMACREASLPCPVGTAGMGLKEFVKSVPDTIFSSPAVNEKLKVLIRDYIYKKGEVLDDCLMRLLDVSPALTTRAAPSHSDAI